MLKYDVFYYTFTNVINAIRIKKYEHFLIWSIDSDVT